MRKIIFIAFLFLTIGINAQISKANVYGYKEITTTQRDALTVPSGQFWTIYNITNNRPERWNGSAWVSSLDAATLEGQNGAYYLNWNNFTNTPTTLSGYGITDAYTKTESDANFYPLGSNPAGYLTSETDPIYSASSWFLTTNNSSNWNTAYSWGDHSLAGYASDSDVVHLTGSETITGTKTFNANTGIMTNTTTGSGYFGINTGSGQSIRVINNGSGRGILVDGGASSTGKLFEGQNNSATTFSVDKTGIVTANQFKKPFGVSTEFLKADGSVDTNTYLTTTGNGSGLTNVDAETLDGIDSGQFLRSDVNDTFSASTITMDNGGNHGFLTGSNSQRLLIGGGLNWSGASGAYIVIEGVDYGGVGLGGNIDLRPAGGIASVNSSAILTDSNFDSNSGVRYLRSNVSDNYTSGNLTFNNNTQLKLGDTSPFGSVGHLKFQATGSQTLADMGADIFFRDAGSAFANRFIFSRSNGNFTATGTIASQGTGNSYFAGNVGIGITSPSHPLTIVSSYPQIKIQQTGQTPSFTFGSGSGFAVFDGIETSGSLLDIRDDGTSRMRIDASGNVGIGTTSPSYKLEVNGTFSSNAIWTTSYHVTEWGTGTTAYGTLSWDTGCAKVFANSGNQLQLAAGGSGTDMTIDTNGNVGIGTTSPAYKLDVSGDGRFTGDVTVPAEAYSSSMNGVQEAVTKDAFYDQVRPYKTYVAIISQTGTGAPTATVLENNIGATVTFARSAAGVYTATASSAVLTSNKTTASVQPAVNNNDGTPTTANVNVTSTTVVTFRTSDIDTVVTTYNDECLNSSIFEIRVYP